MIIRVCDVCGKKFEEMKESNYAQELLDEIDADEKNKRAEQQRRIKNHL